MRRGRRGFRGRRVVRRVGYGRRGSVRRRGLRIGYRM